MIEIRPYTQSELQAVARKFWTLEAADYLISKGVYSSGELEQAREYAATLAYVCTDENGELLESPEQFVDDVLKYEAS